MYWDCYRPTPKLPGNSLVTRKVLDEPNRYQGLFSTGGAIIPCQCHWSQTPKIEGDLSDRLESIEDSFGDEISVENL